MIGKANGTPVTLGAAPGRSDRLASAVRLIPREAGRPTEWAGTYSGETADVVGFPWAASAEANAG